jgi:two-component system alkaline phosphatase synthesis response regulator PhoP
MSDPAPTPNPTTVLLVDDESALREPLAEYLSRQGFVVTQASSAAEARAFLRDETPDLVLLDIMMPKMDGVETCRQIREIPEMQKAFVVFLTARAEEYSEVAAFDVGADDYITKPIKPRALMSRLSAMFRRESKATPQTNIISIGELVIDKSSYTIKVNNREINLPKKEFELLYFLAQNPNKVFSREELLHNIWGTDVYVLARTVDVHVRKVREKIGEDYIATVKGVGYKFSVDKL